MTIIDRLFEPNAYVINGRFNSSFAGAALDIMKSLQHNYRREDVVAFYRFMADFIEKGDFAWAGKNPLIKSSKNDTVKGKEKKEEPIAPSAPDTTFKTMELRIRSAKPTKE